MSTTETPVNTVNPTPANPTPAAQVHDSKNYTSENYTLEVGYTKDELAKPEDKRKPKAYPEGNFSEEDVKNGEWQLLFTQTARIYHPENLDGVEELVSDDEEKVNLFDNQLKVKQINRFRSQVVSQNFTPVDGVIDMFDECGKKSEKRLSPFEKVQNEIMNKFTPEMQARLLEMLKAQQASGSAQ